MSGWYASYWNAFLYFKLYLFNIVDNRTFQSQWYTIYAVSQCTFCLLVTSIFYARIQLCDMIPTLHLWELHICVRQGCYTDGYKSVKRLFYLLIERAHRLQKLLGLMTCSSFLTGTKSLFRFQILLHGLWAVFTHSGWRSEESQSQHCCHVSCDIHSSRVWPVVGLDDSRSGSDDNVVDVWSYVSVEYTAERIITCQSSHGLYRCSHL